MINKYKRVLAILMLFLVVFQPVTANAANDKIYTSYLIGDKEYVSNVTTAKSSWAGNNFPEDNIFEGGLGFLYAPNGDLSNETDGNNPFSYPYILLTKDSFITQTKEFGIAGNTILDILGSASGHISLYPGVDVSKDATKYDMDRASRISSEITLNLNSMLTFINNGKRFKDNNELILASTLIQPKFKKNNAVNPYSPSQHSNLSDENMDDVAGTATTFGDNHIFVSEIKRGGEEFKILYFTDVKAQTMSIEDALKKEKELIKSGNTDKIDELMVDALPSASEEGDLYAYIFKKNNNNMYRLENLNRFIYSMPKGYLNYNVPTYNSNNLINGKEVRNIQIDNPVLKNYYSKNYHSGAISLEELDIKYVSIHTVSSISNFAYQKGFSVNQNSETSGSMNIITRLLVGILQAVLWGIRAILGLYSFEALIFNEGARGGIEYQSGLMRTSWWNGIMEYYMMFLILGALILFVALIKTLIQMNFSTINPNLKFNVMQQIQKIFVTLVIMISIVPIVSFLLEGNNLLVELFASRSPNMSWFGRSGLYQNALVAIFIELVYLYVLIYLNILYLMRGILLAVLIASAPIFVVSMAFTMKGYGLLDNWGKEVISNIFIQSFHAFMFSFLFTVMGTARPIEQLVIVGSLIPLTKIFKNIIIPSSLGLESLSESLTQQASSAGKAVAAVAGAAITGGASLGMSAGAGATASGAMGAKTAASAGSRMTLGKALNARGKELMANGGKAGKIGGMALRGASGIASVGSGAMDMAEGMALGDAGAFKKGTNSWKETQANNISDGFANYKANLDRKAQVRGQEKNYDHKNMVSDLSNDAKNQNNSQAYVSKKAMANNGITLSSNYGNDIISAREEALEFSRGLSETYNAQSEVKTAELEYNKAKSGLLSGKLGDDGKPKYTKDYVDKKQGQLLQAKQRLSERRDNHGILGEVTQHSVRNDEGEVKKVFSAQIDTAKFMNNVGEGFNNAKIENGNLTFNKTKKEDGERRNPTEEINRIFSKSNKTNN